VVEIIEIIMQIIRTILIILIVYYLIKLAVRYLLPIWARYFIRKKQSQMNQQYQEPQKKEGEIHVESKPTKKKSADQLGDYVDYEEIKED
jgi:flagellar biosynthesis/type III secretory pathway M-ring protein FliF/YscJ